MEVWLENRKAARGRDSFHCFLNRWREESTSLGIILLQYYFSYPNTRIIEFAFRRKQGDL